MTVENINLDGINWPPGSLARIWFCQPQIELTVPAPFVPRPEVRSLELLRAVPARDAELGAPSGGAPSIILLPEFSLRPQDVPRVRELIRGARPNTLLICGVGHLSAEEFDRLDSGADLCQAPVPGCFANCALICCGGSDQVFLQPKIVPSREELNFHWPGKVIRYFEGQFFAFVVFICSEMLNRAEERTTIEEVLEWLGQHNRRLSAVFWLQHNRRPRAADFSESLGLLTDHQDRPTTFVAGSRQQYPPRLENFAVSGALVPKSVVARHFDILTRRFHYVEPVPDHLKLSRVVLLRYDVDVNLVDTVLASSIREDARTERSQLFQSVVPLFLQNDALIEDVQNTHLFQILLRGRDRASETQPAVRDHVYALAGDLVALCTPEFQDFLDRAILPRPSAGDVRHAAGHQHYPGDSFCLCWQHRTCIDVLCDDPEAAEPITHVLLAIANIRAQGINVALMPASNPQANLLISVAGTPLPASVVYPFDFNGDSTTIGIRGDDRPVLAEPAYIVLGTSSGSGRPKLAEVSQAVAGNSSPLRPASPASPGLRAVFNEEFQAACISGSLAALFRERFT